MSAKQIIVTTSWDDGDLRDLRLADLLAARGMKGTFYCPVEPFSSDPALSKADMRAMVAGGFEIGGHGVAHEIMSELPANKIDGIVTGCKAYLEDVLGQRITSFCYPRGRFTASAVEAVRRAGYQGARTVRLLATDSHPDLFRMPTSVQVYPHTRVEYLRNIARAGSVQRLLDYSFGLKLEQDWIAIGKQLFERVLADGGIWHLWGHSWEIDALGLWGPLAEMLDYVAGRDQVLYLTNGELGYLLANRSN
ncbi:MAG: polysaccharide deacetylase family protein [Acidobacteriales bacterium]|nr:polysaccharide deacetylase family protein [Terriglobales bacterium]